MIATYPATLHIDDRRILCSLIQRGNVFEVRPIADNGPSDKGFDGREIRAAWSDGKPAILSVQSVALRRVEENGEEATG